MTLIHDGLRGGLTIPSGKYYLADAGYSNTAFTLVPYKRAGHHFKKVESPDNNSRLKP